MMNCLRQNLLYSEKLVRNVLFRAIEQVLLDNRNQAGAITFSRLVREASIRGRRDGETARIDGISWDMSARAVLNMMLNAGALLDRFGNPVPPGVAAHAAPIAGLHSECERLSEAYLWNFSFASWVMCPRAITGPSPMRCSANSTPVS